MNGDLLGSILIIGSITIFLILCEIMTTKKIISSENTRKLIHISVGNILFFVPLFENKLIVTAIPLVFVIGDFFLSPLTPLQKIRLKTFSAGHSWGTIFYPASLAFVIYFGFDNLWISLAAFFSVVYGDGFAAVIGPKAKTGIFKIYGNEKTLLGTLTVSFASWISVLVGIVVLGENLVLAIVVSSIVAVIAPILELLSPRGTDNLLMPPILFSILILIEDQISSATHLISIPTFFTAVVLGTAVAIISYVKGFLTLDGALAGFLLAIVMLGLNGWSFGIQLFIFFAFGTIATKIVRKKEKQKQDEFEKGTEKRDSKQALAKAGSSAIIAILYLFRPVQAIFYLYSGILASSLTDTMATEVGIAFKGKTRPVLRPWRLAEKGESGAISAIGTWGGFLFGLLMTLIVYLTSIIDSMMTITTPLFIVIVALAGVIGMLADSILGSTIQKMNKCQICGKELEADIHCEQETQYLRGWKFIKNDVVNFFGTLIGGITGYTFYYIFI